MNNDKDAMDYMYHLPEKEPSHWLDTFIPIVMPIIIYGMTFVAMVGLVIGVWFFWNLMHLILA